MNKHKIGSIVACLILLAGCATPAAVKEATVALDQGYNDNLKMMQQYRELVIQINERHFHWWQYIQRRAFLGSALLWMTTDPRSTDPEVSDEELVNINSVILGDTLLDIINGIRLSDLPERKGEDGKVVFEKNTPDSQNPLRGTVGDIIQNLPTLINAIDARIESNYKAIVKNDLSGFDAYKTNVEALVRINDTIKRYLDIDVTVRAQDIDEIADAIRKLQ